MDNQIRTIFSKNMYDLDRQTVILMTARLDSLGCPYHSDIACALRTLFPARKLHPWVFSLTYEELMHRFLLDSVYHVCYGLGHVDMVCTDIREVDNFTTVYRYPIGKHLIYKFRKFKLGQGKFPQPPRGWKRF